MVHWELYTQLMAVGDCWPEAVKLSKGDYVVRVQVTNERHLGCSAYRISCAATLVSTSLRFNVLMKDVDEGAKSSAFRFLRGERDCAGSECQKQSAAA